MRASCNLASRAGFLSPAFISNVDAKRRFVSTATTTARVWNSASRRLEAVASRDNLLTMYVCGPTVYDVAHIGHARTYLVFDAIRRTLRDEFRFNVAYCVNLTDVDDKIIRKAEASNASIKEITSKFEGEFWRDMDVLNVERPDFAPRATDHIDSMVGIIRELTEGGYAYRAPDGSVYFDTKKADDDFKYPGSLAPGRAIQEEDGAAGAPSSSGKKHPSDFALWKAQPADAPHTWSAAPWGSSTGRPGWHLECSAMIDETIGKIRNDGRVDIHGGGVDLCVPHHCNERAQSEALLRVRAGRGRDAESGDWSKLFLHSGHVTTSEDVKMSKSLGNFVTIRDCLTILTPRQLRFALLCAAKYSSNLEWNEGVIQRAQTLDASVEAFLKRVETDPRRSSVASAKDLELLRSVHESREKIRELLGNDFDFSGVADELRRLIRKSLHEFPNATWSPEEAHSPGIVAAKKLVRSTLGMLGFPAFDVGQAAEKADDSSELSSGKVVDVLVKFRSEVRTQARAKNLGGVLQACDAARKQCAEELSVLVEDRRDGSSTWRPQ